MSRPTDNSMPTHNRVLKSGAKTRILEMTNSAGWTRREFIGTGIGAMLAPMVLGCGSPTGVIAPDPRLTARPVAPTVDPTLGLSTIDLSSGFTGQLYVPTTYSPDNPAPLFVALHGAGGRAENWESYHARAEDRGMIFLAPNSAGATWDIVTTGFGVDIDRMDRALEYTFARCQIDATRIALAGFSDGASYGLSVGVTNGDLFSHLVGYSPGFMIAPNDPIGLPRVFVSHGVNDTILPVTSSRDTIVPFFQENGYDVMYEEFDGGHVVPAEITEAALDWLVSTG